MPTLVIDGVAHHESTALLMLLSERHPDCGFAPEPGTPHRAEWLEQTIFLANTVLPAMRDWFLRWDRRGCGRGGRGAGPSPGGGSRPPGSASTRTFQGGRLYMVGERLSTADFLAVMLMRWTRNMPKPATTWPNLRPYIERTRAMPSFIEVNRREGLTDWLNA